MKTHTTWARMVVAIRLVAVTRRRCAGLGPHWLADEDRVA
jgi:hypothetical protein